LKIDLSLNSRENLRVNSKVNSRMDLDLDFKSKFKDRFKNRFRSKFKSRFKSKLYFQVKVKDRFPGQQYMWCAVQVKIAVKVAKRGRRGPVRLSR